MLDDRTQKIYFWRGWGQKAEKRAIACHSPMQLLAGPYKYKIQLNPPFAIYSVLRETLVNIVEDGVFPETHNGLELHT